MRRAPAIVMVGFAAWLLQDLVFAQGAQAQTSEPQNDPHSHHQHHNMTLDASGMVMNSNSDKLPRDCKKMGPDVVFTVSAGTEYAKDNPGTTFGFSQHEFAVEPCSRVTVTFENKDQIRHQWMVHGLPKYLYPAGMFHLEAAGGHSQTGTFIVPSDNRTYLVHCDIAQHMEKGMKGQLKVGRGNGDLWGIPGVSSAFEKDSYMPESVMRYAALAGVLLALFALLTYRRLRKKDE